ncbi:hypothetical protein JCM6882_006965 [Rhodosporidiobolus microsporus]
MALASSTTSPPSNDLLTSLAFSPLSTHLALSSLDHTIRILHPSPSSSSNGAAAEWTHAPREWKAHDGPVLCVAWAAPEFGNVLASGGVDGAVKVWREEEAPPAFSSNGASSSSSAAAPKRYGPATLGSGPGTSTGWGLLTPSSLPSPSFSPIRSLSFAPAEFGLKLAAVSSDNHLRVWECLDPVGGREWVLVQDVEVASLPLGACSAASVAGNSGVILPGVDGASSVETPGASSATGSVDGRASGSGGQGTAGGVSKGGTVESDGGWAVSWCREHWWGERVAVSAGTNGVVRLFHFPPSTSPQHSTTGPWTQFLTLLPSTFSTHSAFSSRPSTAIPSSSTASGGSGGGDDFPPSHAHTPPTSSLSFAPPSGRSFQLLAAGARDGKARVWKLFPPSLAAPATAGPSAGGSATAAGGEAGLEEGDWTAKLDVELDAGASPSDGREGRGVGSGGGSATGGSGAGGSAALGSALAACKVEWNVTGTVLSTSGGGGGTGAEEGRVRLWKPTYTGQWRLLASLSTEDAPPPSAGSSSHAAHPHHHHIDEGRGGSPVGGYRIPGQGGEE